MIKNVTQPVKIIDNFFEQPWLVEHHANKQEFVDQDNSVFPGLRSATLDEIDIDMFERLLGKLIKHVLGKEMFTFLHCEYQKMNERCIDQIKQISTQANIAGTVFLTENTELDSGICFYDNKHNPTINVENVYNRCVLWDPKEHYKVLKYKPNTLMLTFYGTAVQRYPTQ